MLRLKVDLITLNIFLIYGSTSVDEVGYKRHLQFVFCFKDKGDGSLGGRPDHSLRTEDRALRLTPTLMPTATLPITQT